MFETTPDEVTSEQRRYAKVINFGLIYGMSAFGLAANLGIERDAREALHRPLLHALSGRRRLHAADARRGQAKGYVETVFGRRLWLSEINSPNGPRRAAAERAAINAPMQGTAADLIKHSMIAVQDWLERERLGTKMIMQVHDELVLEVPDAELALIRERIPALMASVADVEGAAGSRTRRRAELGSRPLTRATIGHDAASASSARRNPRLAVRRRPATRPVRSAFPRRRSPDDEVRMRAARAAGATHPP